MTKSRQPALDICPLQFMRLKNCSAMPGTRAQGWTGLLSLSELPHEKVIQWRILPGPIPGKLIQTHSSNGAQHISRAHCGFQCSLTLTLLLDMHDSNPTLPSVQQHPGHKDRSDSDPAGFNWCCDNQAAATTNCIYSVSLATRPSIARWPALLQEHYRRSRTGIPCLFAF